jgi:hypothetical protein
LANVGAEMSFSRRSRGGVPNRLWTNLNWLWMIPPVGVAYAYELRRGEEILSTGRLTIEQELAPGDELTIAGMPALADKMGWVNGESRLLLKSAPTLDGATTDELAAS